MRKSYFVKAHIMKDGEQIHEYWAVERVFFWKNPVIFIREFMNEKEKIHPNCTVIVTQFNRV